MRRAFLAFGLVAALLAGGCGIPTEREPRQLAITPAAGPTTPAAGPTPSQTGSQHERLYLVGDGALTPVDRAAVQPPTVATVLRDLLIGPNDEERTDGLTSALLGTDVVGGVGLDAGTASVQLTGGLDDPARTDEVLAYGQLVCTLTAVPGVSGVRFTRNGAPVGIPRADGSLAWVPLTCTDYADLQAKPSASASPSVSTRPS